MGLADKIEVEIPTTLTFDRRSTDSDGRLTATECVLTRANVSMYIGGEIPGYQQLGLDPNAVYPCYRDPVALKAAMPGLNGKPLMMDHVLTSATDPQKSLIVGTVVDCRWVGDAIVGTVVVWDRAAIEAIESKALRDLSCGYRYTPVRKDGIAPGGDRYNILMTGPIEFNHIALVSEGRVDGAFVADSAHSAAAEVLARIPHLNRL